jgi:hypothetical protein
MRRRQQQKPPKQLKKVKVSDFHLDKMPTYYFKKMIIELRQRDDIPFFLKGSFKLDWMESTSQFNSLKLK